MKLTHIQRSILAQLAKHGLLLEDVVCHKDTSKKLHAAGLIIREPGQTHPPSFAKLSITDAGRALLRPQDGCPCKDCRR